MLTLKHRTFYLPAVLVLFLCLFFIYKDLWYISMVLPAVFFTVLCLLLSTEKIYYLVAFLTPLSFTFYFGNAGLNIPNEPLLIVLSAVFILRLAAESKINYRFFNHPMVIALILHVFWLCFTSFTSVNLLVSAKLIIARLWCIVPLTLFGALFFNKTKNIVNYLLSFSAGFALLVIYTTYRHYSNGFSQQSGTWVMTPFFSDHTIYGAIAAFLLMILLIFFWYRKMLFKGSFTLPLMILIALTGLALMLSYSRAAWISEVAAMLFLLLIYFKTTFKSLVLLSLISLIIIAFSSDTIIRVLKNNKAVSGKTLEQDLQSVTNITNDDSNTERLNRWQAGLRMFAEKPVLGYGPGTYRFQYSGFQRAHEMTYISSTQGEKGGIHSEYLNPLIETGVPGFLSFLLLIYLFLAAGFKCIYQQKDKTISILALAITCGMVTYLTHGFFNNFLDQDKAAILFWSAFGMMLALDLKRREFVNLA